MLPDRPFTWIARPGGATGEWVTILGGVHRVEHRVRALVIIGTGGVCDEDDIIRLEDFRRV
jgi:hypothetical protein